MAKASDAAYEGPVCYHEGWHRTVVKNGDGYDEPGELLVLEDDGSYRLAGDADESWHDRKHQKFITVEMEDGGPALRLSESDFEDVKRFLAEREGSDS